MIHDGGSDANDESNDAIDEKKTATFLTILRKSPHLSASQKPSLCFGEEV